MDRDGNGQGPFEWMSSWNGMRVSSHEVANIVSRAAGDLVKTQFELSTVASPIAPESPARLLWHMPALMQAQFQRIAQVSWESFSVLIRTQQQLLELEGQSLSSGTRDATHALSSYLGTLASRRTKEKEINFADRRATARAVENAVASINAEAARRKANPGKKNITS